MKILFVEHAYQVEDFLSKVDYRDAEWIALGPSAMYALEKKKISFKIPENFLSLEVIRKECLEQFDILKNIIVPLDDAILKSNSFLNKWEIRPFSFNLWSLASLIDALISRALWIRTIIEKKTKSKIFIHIAPVHQLDSTGLSFGKHESLWSRIILESRWKDDVVVFQDPYFEKYSKNCQSSNLNIKYYVKKKIKANILLNSVLTSFRQNLHKNIYNLMKYSNHDHIFVLNDASEWKYVLPELSIEGLPILFFNDSLFSSIELTDLSDNDLDTNIFENFFSSLNNDYINISSIIGDRIIWILKQTPCISQKLIAKMEIICAKKNPLALLAIPIPSFQNNVIKHYFIKKSFPVFTFQHGAVWFDDRITQRVDLIDAHGTNILFSYGEAVRNAYEKSGLPVGSKVKVVGSNMLDDLR